MTMSAGVFDQFSHKQGISLGVYFIEHTPKVIDQISTKHHAQTHEKHTPCYSKRY
jgi:hypothetical protein